MCITNLFLKFNGLLKILNRFLNIFYLFIKYSRIIVHKCKNLNILYECDPALSPSGDWFKASHYRNTYQISFDYECEYDPPATIDEILPSLTLVFPSETGKIYKIEWSTTPDTLPLEKWHEITTFMAEDTVTSWTDSGGDDREPTYHPSERYYQVWLMNP